MSSKEEKKVLSELRKSVKALRDAHVGKSVTKMSADELAREKSHHETAVRAMEVKAKRMEGLAKAREARGKTAAASATKPAGATKEVAPKRVKSESRVSDKKAKETTVGDLVSEKKKLPKKSSDSPKDE